MLSIRQQAQLLNMLDKGPSHHSFKYLDQVGGESYRSVILGYRPATPLVDGADQDKE